ncbi:hypothetical protein RIF23_14755 [Lipingzhangella sp. LS1_29]|uniref:ASCH domain-containing protein n=1 Tax=Lipingzhangella rawalii TaxID=2055835 RepID=A0ABU2H8D3_9ACTN|nr:hypothetical protein [Lipingzhangella rawalii]MDS1271557.1 hypothetical protein [Lipingzhangella rawalii]
MDRMHDVPPAGNDTVTAAWQDVISAVRSQPRSQDRVRTYPALTVWQPWVWAILHGKDVENRPWAPARPPGTVVLHAGARQDTEAVPVLEDIVGGPLPRSAFTTGLLALVDITEIHHASDCRPHGYCSPWAASSGYHWTLNAPRALPTPIPARGRQRLWHLTIDQHASVQTQLDTVRPLSPPHGPGA